MIKPTQEIKNLLDEATKPEALDKMNELTEPKKPNPLIDGLVEWGNTMDFAKLPDNAVIAIKVGIDDPIYGNKMQQTIVQSILQPRIEILKEKKIAVIFMSAEDDISTLSEEEMAAAGWEKKDKSRIITL